MRIVLDTNVVVSALIWGGTPDKLMQMAIDGDVELCTSPELLDELRRVLLRQHLISRLGPRHASVQDAITLYAELAVSVSPTSVPRDVLADPPCGALNFARIRPTGQTNEVPTAHSSCQGLTLASCDASLALPGLA